MEAAPGEAFLNKLARIVDFKEGLPWPRGRLQLCGMHSAISATYFTSEAGQGILTVRFAYRNDVIRILGAG